LSKNKPSTRRRQHANITASDVAKRAGVSPMTVSRVINGEASVRKSTKQAVNDAIRELGYSPNKAARSLASADQIRIGLLYSNPSSTYLSKMLLGVLEQARQSDTQIVVVECAAGSDTDAVIDGMVEDGVDGIILAPPLCDSTQAFRTLRRNRVPTVTVGSPHKADEISSVCIDDYLAAQTITRHIISLGHTRISFIIGNAEQAASQLRLAGFRAALQEAGLEVFDELIIQGEFSYLSGFEAAGQLLDLDSPPTAIVASNDDMAAGVIAMAHRHHVEVPADLTVCGFDDTFFATTIWPTITTIRQPIAEMSSLAIEMLEKMIRGRRRHAGKEIKGKHRELDFLLMLRDSDSPPSESKDKSVSGDRKSSLARRFGSGSSRKPPA
jgi:LacI family transcriptional regulator